MSTDSDTLDSTIVLESPDGEGERPVRLQTLPCARRTGRLAKRIIVCCDGTWQDGVLSKKRWQGTNILKLSRMMNHYDERYDLPIPQVIFYQAGVGTDNNFYSEYIDGATGLSLVSKVQEAYAFIASNYHPGDEIFLFGFSRGAYTARMTAALIGEIGVLDKHDMDHFATIFFAYQKRGNLTDANEIAKSKALLERWNNPNAKGRIRAAADNQPFTIKCLGVFDTVGSIGLPEELRFSHKLKCLFGFPDNYLGAHVEYAFHAMALDEHRSDFNVTKFLQTNEGRQKGQVLKQVWFTGCHADIGGGYLEHDLADITLTWMASNIESMLSLDHNYLRNIPQPTAAWGAQLPHNSAVGIFKLSHAIQRELPTKTDEDTHEFIHISVQEQYTLNPTLAKNIQLNPALVCTLEPLEREIKIQWPNLTVRHGHGTVETLEEAFVTVQVGQKNTLLKRARTAVTATFKSRTMQETHEVKSINVKRLSWITPSRTKYPPSSERSEDGTLQ